MRRFQQVSVVLGLILLAGWGLQAHAEEARQVAVSPTPVPINLPSPIPLDAPQPSQTTATPTRTPTPVGPAILEAKTEANVRAQPDPESELLGTIRAGDFYPIIGRYFRWVQFQYDSSPNGTGWVFDELINIVGDETAIIDLSVQEAPTVDTTAVEQTAAFEAITLTPGGLLTATANARVITIPELPVSGAADTLPELPVDAAQSPSPLPTFTIPPNLIPATPTSAAADGLPVATATLSGASPSPPSPDSVPPITPILILGAAGILGIAVSFFRR
ncbi:MAG: SH3 domain-containing protein [Chloroflexi bacterium]|nr:SH3 domain-containing protein [Chloroflexota bacterium]